MKKLTLLLAIVLCLVFPVAAQGDNPNTLSEEELEAVSFVGEAIENFLLLESYTVDGENNISQEISLAGFTLNQVLDQDISGVYTVDDDGNVAVSALLDQSIETVGGGQNVEGTMTMEMIIVDDTFYAQVSGATGALAAGVFPEGWVNVNDNPNAIPGLSAINLDTYVSLFNTAVAYPIEPASVLSITEQEETTGDDGQALRVFTVEFDVEYLDESGSLDQVLGAFDFSSFGLSQEDADALIAAFVDGMELFMTVSIGTDDKMIYAIGSELFVDAEFSGDFTQGETMQLVQTVTANINYSNFNEPAEVTAPEVE